MMRAQFDCAAGVIWPAMPCSIPTKSARTRFRVVVREARWTLERRYCSQWGNFGVCPDSMGGEPSGAAPATHGAEAVGKVQLPPAFSQTLDTFLIGDPWQFYCFWPSTGQ